MVLTELARLFDSSTSNHRSRFYCTIDRSSPLNCTVYLSLYLGYCYNSREHLWKAFLRTFQILKGNERMRDIRSSWEDVTTAAGPILLRLGRATKMAVFWSYFRDFVGAQKIEDLSESGLGAL